MSKQARQESEPVVMASLLAAELRRGELAESPLDEARQQAFGSPQFSITDNTFFTGKPQKVEIDRDGDGKADAFANIDYTIFGNLDTITVTNAATGKTEYTMNTSRTLGHATQLTADLNGDGKNDITIKPRAGWVSNNIGRLDIDRDGDGKADANMDVDRTWLPPRYLSTLDYDRDNDGKVDKTFKVSRYGFSGNLKALKEVEQP